MGDRRHLGWKQYSIRELIRAAALVSNSRENVNQPSYQEGNVKPDGLPANQWVFSCWRRLMVNALAVAWFLYS